MRIDYAISTWNFTHFSTVHPFAEQVPVLLEQGLGVEFWNPLWDGTDLRRDDNWRTAAGHFEGLPISWHGRRDATQPLEEQVDTLHKMGGRVIVIHRKWFPEADADAASVLRDLVAYAAERDVWVALENGEFGMIGRFVSAVDGLKFCLDTGHAVMEAVPLRQYVTEFGDALCHLHIQDVATEPEKGVTYAQLDHFTLGTGGTTREDWEGFRDALDAVNFEGMGVFELRPRPAQQDLLVSRAFMDHVLSG